jgi:hypothetical protein
MVGFYPRYFSKPFDTISYLVHAHMIFMLTWVGLSIVQPLLILKNKIALHKLIGRISYWIMPLIFGTGYIALRSGYDKRLNGITKRVASGDLAIDAAEIPRLAADRMILVTVYFLLLVTLYLLAIRNRKNIQLHATYMLGAIFTSLGPSAGRAIFFIHSKTGTKPGFLSANGIEIFVILFFTILSMYQKRRGYSAWPALTVAGMYFFGLLFAYLLSSKTHVWQIFIEFFLVK